MAQNPQQQYPPSGASYQQLPPGPAPTTVVYVTQPATVDITQGQMQNVRPWTSGLCGCFEDMSSCCCAFWCYPCFLCALASDMNENCCGPWCCGSGCKAGGLHYCSINPFVVAMRTRMRSQYGITGSICDDLMCTCCCECCVATQIAREWKNINKRKHLM